MRPALTVPHASQQARDALGEHTEVSLPEFTLPDLPEMPDMPQLNPPMFPDLKAPENLPAQAQADFDALPAAHMPDIFDLF